MPYNRSTLTLVNLTDNTKQTLTICTERNGPWSMTWSERGKVITFHAAVQNDEANTFLNLIRAGAMTNRTMESVDTNALEEITWKVRVPERLPDTGR